jgi:hypothetical protein
MKAVTMAMELFLKSAIKIAQAIAENKKFIL